MSQKDAVYIASISGGKCIENTSNTKKVCRLRKWSKSSEQQWAIEFAEGDEKTLAFRSVVDNKYLTPVEPKKSNGSEIGVGDDVFWWTIEDGQGPGRFHVRTSEASPGAKTSYLNDEWGRMQDDNKIQLYQFEANNPGFNTFYFTPAEAGLKELVKKETAPPIHVDEAATTNGTIQIRDSGEADTSKPDISEDLYERIRDVMEREKAIAKREDTVAKKEAEVADNTNARNSQNASIRYQDEISKLQQQVKALKSQRSEPVCQHHIKRPPRKIDHRVVGYVYD